MATDSFFGETSAIVKQRTMTGSERRSDRCVRPANMIRLRDEANESQEEERETNRNEYDRHETPESHALRLFDRARRARWFS